jgi:hypothetical protein
MSKYSDALKGILSIILILFLIAAAICFIILVVAGSFDLADKLFPSLNSTTTVTVQN